MTGPGAVTAPPRCEIVVVGGSWGGLAASLLLLAALPAPLPVPVLLVLHRARRSEGEMIERVVTGGCGHPASEVGDKDPLVAGTIHVAPPDYHVFVERGQVSLSVEGPVNFSRPSIDLAFESAALEYTSGLVAVVLSGAGRDGAAGTGEVRRRGGRVMVQDPEDAERGEMPRAAIAMGQVDAVAPVPVLGERLRVVLVGEVGG